ncbi:MAG: type II toxin-antitoxin system death-on-curing family toxin [Azospirillaceae bacterium]|nr:type II toxin-antitoxin system death-on-curing family toxin [Azospirillaceae bacterium]
MTELILPPIEAIIDLHAELLVEHGGAPGLRDRGALEASLARAHQILAYSEGPVTVFDLAAVVCVGILRNRPFVDGNKRAGFVALGMTLILNGLFLDVSEREAADMILSVAARERFEEEFRLWVADHSVEA